MIFFNTELFVLPSNTPKYANESNYYNHFMSSFKFLSVCLYLVARRSKNNCRKDDKHRRLNYAMIKIANTD